MLKILMFDMAPSGAPRGILHWTALIRQLCRTSNNPRITSKFRAAVAEFRRACRRTSCWELPLALPDYRADSLEERP
jgi:hypothetical protein